MKLGRVRELGGPGTASLRLGEGVSRVAMSSWSWPGGVAGEGIWGVRSSPLPRLAALLAWELILGVRQRSLGVVECVPRGTIREGI